VWVGGPEASLLGAWGVQGRGAWHSWGEVAASGTWGNALGRPSHPHRSPRRSQPPPPPTHTKWRAPSPPPPPLAATRPTGPPHLQLQQQPPLIRPLQPVPAVHAVPVVAAVTRAGVGAVQRAQEDRIGPGPHHGAGQQEQGPQGLQLLGQAPFPHHAAQQLPIDFGHLRSIATRPL